MTSFKLFKVRNLNLESQTNFSAMAELYFSGWSVFTFTFCGHFWESTAECEYASFKLVYMYTVCVACYLQVHFTKGDLVPDNCFRI